MSVLHETCLEYFRRRLTEGWKCISLEGYNAVLLSPEGIRRELDLRNDVETLRPDTAGDECNISHEVGAACPNHYQNVDEVIPDENTTLVYVDGLHDWERDLYSIENHSVGSGTINSVKVYGYCASTSNNPTQAGLMLAIKTGGVVYESTPVLVPLGWAYFSNTWAQNPGNAHAWTWDEVDALQAGIALRECLGDGGGGVKCTQVYVEVDYTSVTEKSSSDTGSGANAYVSLETGEIKTSSDAGSGAEGTPMQSATLFGGETGSGIEAYVARLLAAFDTGTGAEVSGLLKDLFASELGQGSDSFVAKIETPTKGGGMKLWI